MKYLFCLVLLWIVNISNAQTETTNWLYNLEGKTPERPKIQNHKHETILKILNLSRYFDNDFILGESLKQAVNNGKLTIYRDKKCKNAYSKVEAQNVILRIQIDTILNLLPDFNEKIKIVREEVSFFPNEETVYELEQSWKYDKKQNQLTMSLDAIHVYFLERNANGNVEDLINRNYLFSIKNKDAKKVIPQKELEKMSVIWAKEFSYTGDFNNEKLRAILLSESHRNAHKITATYDRNKELTNVEIKELTTTQITHDTIITFDPETFEEKITIIKSKVFYDATHITSFRIVQDFYFDTATNTFKTRILAVAPMRKRFDDNGNLKFQYPMFWIVYEEDF